MLKKESLFDELFKNAETSIEKELIKKLFDLVESFYYVLDIYNDYHTNLKIFNYLYRDLEIFTIEDIANLSYVNERTIRRFKKKTDQIIITLIKTDGQYATLNKLLIKHNNA